MPFGSDSFMNFNDKYRPGHGDRSNNDLGIASSALDDAIRQNEQTSNSIDAHRSEVVRRIGELGLGSGSRVIFDDGVSKKVLTIKEINPQTGKITFEESNKLDVGIFSPSLEKYSEVSGN